ncbi:sensor domain-containing diguanylate cyclase [Rossellomorea vietnamensis]|uniref:Sensor domain-containing diguanylate cyclase n=1 Tax=Rossellomorea aquimaris TaxID=189382 RepID=A0A5D4UAS0_9BACI|nr:sensor domain-containing diguanylate cyclase [Rossellomorea aquimaris]TYS84201.1 sensor domain-containing diguanylate cyclase [Rossellomorea aquimaris]
MEKNDCVDMQVIGMERKDETFLNGYKAQLFDLVNEEFNEEDDNASQCLFSWMKAVRDTLQAETVLFYQRMENCYQLTEAITTENHPVSVFPDVLEDIFKDSHEVCVKGTDSHTDFASFDYAFRMMDDQHGSCGVLLASGIVSHDVLTLSKDVLEKFSVSSCAFLKKMNLFLQVIEDEHRYRELFKVNEAFHSSMDINILLGQIISTLTRVFPDYHFHLLLSNDNDKNHGDLPIKDFDYDSANTAAMEAFVNGTIETEHHHTEQKLTLYAPLKGKQGVYGVLEVVTGLPFKFPENQREFVRLLAYTAGSALENAKLYQQSRRLISDLQLINETSHRLNSNLRMAETLAFLKKQIKRSFQASSIGFVFIDKRGEYKVLTESSSFFHGIEGTTCINYVKRKIFTDKEAIFIGDLSGKFGKELSYLSLMAVPMVQNGSIIGFCIVLHKEPYSFSFDMYKLLQSFIHHSTLALTNSMLREKLEELVITDHLTQLYSRNYLDEEMDRAMKRDEQGALLLLDIDNFKKINDTYGHQIGDEVLIQVAKVLMEESKGAGFAARWGGEELAVYLPHIDLKSGISIGSRIVEQIPRGTKPSVTVSCGVSSWKRGREDHVKDLVKRADASMYYAKNNGKNQVANIIK